MAQTPFFIGFWRVLKLASNPLTHVEKYIFHKIKDWVIQFFILYLTRRLNAK